MTETILIRDVVRASNIIGTRIRLNFIKSYQSDEETYSTATEFESDIFGFFLIDFFLQSKPVSPGLRQKYFGVLINDLTKRHGPKLNNKNLDALIELRFNKYADIIQSAGEKWQQPANEALERNLKGTKNTKTISEVYPIDIMDILDEIPYKTAFIRGQIQNMHFASVITEKMNKGISLDFSIHKISKLDSKVGKREKEDSYIASILGLEPTDKELEAIKVSEEMYNNQKKGFLRIIRRKSFRFDMYATSETKNLESLWQRYGLISSNKYSFSDEQKIELIDRWFNILYPFKKDIKSSYNRDLEDFRAYMRKSIQEKPHMRINFDFPSPEKYLKDITDRFGFYDNPKVKED